MNNIKKYYSYNYTKNILDDNDDENKDNFIQISKLGNNNNHNYAYKSTISNNKGNKNLIATLNKNDTAFKERRNGSQDEYRDKERKVDKDRDNVNNAKKSLKKSKNELKKSNRYKDNDDTREEQKYLNDKKKQINYITWFKSQIAAVCSRKGVTILRNLKKYWKRQLPKRPHELPHVRQKMQAAKRQ